MTSKAARDRGFDYERVEASQTDQAIGATGAQGDFLHKIILEATTGTIIVKDGSTTVLTIPAAQAIDVWEVNLISKNGAWNVTTAASTSCVCVGDFT